MSALTITLAVLCQFFLVASQLFFKHGMRSSPGPRCTWNAVRHIGLGILCQSLWFFVWTNLLKDNRLSRIFPFEGLNPVFLVLASWILLRERLSGDIFLGVVLICAGLFLVAGS